MEGTQDMEYEMMASVTEKGLNQEAYTSIGKQDTSLSIYAIVGEAQPTQPSTSPRDPVTTVSSKPRRRVRYVIALTATVALITVAILALVVVMTVTVVDQDGYRELRDSVLRTIHNHDILNNTIMSLTGSISSVWSFLNKDSDPSQKCIVNDTMQCTINNSSEGSEHWKNCFTPRVNLSMENDLYPVDIRCDYQSLMENQTVLAGSAKLVRVDHTTYVCICDVFAVGTNGVNSILEPIPPTLNTACILTTVWCPDHGGQYINPQLL